LPIFDQIKEQEKELSKKETIDINQFLDVKTLYLKTTSICNDLGVLGMEIKKGDIALEKWQTYFKFTFVRNPYDKAISSYEFMKQKKFDANINHDVLNPECTFTHFYKYYFKYYMNNYTLYHSFQSQYVTIKNSASDIQIDYIAKYENINEEIINILNKLNIKNCTKHLHLIDEQFKSNSTQKSKITSYFTQETLEIINILFHEDFERFGYKKFYKLEELNHYLEQIKEKEENINKNLLNFYNYQPKTVTDEDIINELFIYELVNDM